MTQTSNSLGEHKVAKNMPTSHVWNDLTLFTLYLHHKTSTLISQNIPGNKTKLWGQFSALKKKKMVLCVKGSRHTYKEAWLLGSVTIHFACRETAPWDEASLRDAPLSFSSFSLNTGTQPVLYKEEVLLILCWTLLRLCSPLLTVTASKRLMKNSHSIISQWNKFPLCINKTVVLFQSQLNFKC